MKIHIFIFALILLSCSGLAAELTDILNQPPTNTDPGNTICYGMNIRANYAVRVINVGFDAVLSADTCYICSGTDQLATAPLYVNHTCYITGLNLTLGQTVSVCASSQGGAYNARYSVGRTFPENDTNIAWIERVGYNSANCAGGVASTSSVQSHALVNITTEIITAPPGIQDLINISTPYPNNNTKHWNINTININLTANISTLFLNGNYTLYLDGILNESKNVASGEQVIGTFIKTLSEGIHKYSINVTLFNAGGAQNSSEATANYTLIIDTVSPTITINPSNSFSEDNTTVISNYLNNLTLNLSFFDNNLYQVLINITNATGSIFSYHNKSLGATTTLNFSSVIDLTDKAISEYTVSLQASDSHTALSIPDYEIKKGLFGTYIEYKTPDGSIIRIESKENFFNIKDFTTKKLTDRYTFSIEFNNLITQTTFILRSNNPLTYLKASNYPGHFVTGNNWIDFKEFTVPGSSIDVTLIDAYTAEIQITDITTKQLNFNSIGGLNIQTQDYKFRLGAVLHIFAKDIFNNNSINFSLTFGGTEYNTTTAGAYLTNVTTGPYDLTINNTAYVILNSNVTVSAKYHNFTYYLYPLGVYLYFRNEIDGQLLTVDPTHNFSVYLENATFSKLYQNIVTNPYYLTNTSAGEYKLNAYSPSYPRRQYQRIIISASAVSNITGYFIPSTIGESKLLTVRNSNQEPIENALITIYRLINGQYITVNDQYTDFAGQNPITLDPNYQYKMTINATGYPFKAFFLQPSVSSYTITLLGENQAIYINPYTNTKYRILYNGIPGLPELINISSSYSNITFEVIGTGLEEIGINLSSHSYLCEPVNCTKILSTSVGGSVTIEILLNSTGHFNTAFWFKRSTESRTYVNDGVVKVVPFIYGATKSLVSMLAEFKDMTTPNVRTIFVAGASVLLIGIGASLGLYGFFLILPALVANIIFAQPTIGFINPFVGYITAIFGVVVLLFGIVSGAHQ